MLDVVDLGTKHGNAMTTFLKRAGVTVLPHKQVLSFSRTNCRGYERPEAEAYRKEVEAKQFQFATLDLSQPAQLAELPEASVYLAWHLLEHLPNATAAYWLIWRALSQAKQLAWFRLPSFEQDRRGEGALRPLGLRFSWTNWRGHPNPYLVADCQQAVADWQKQNPERKCKVVTKPAGYIYNTDDRQVVPIGAPVDTNFYNKTLGPKPKGVLFAPPLVSEWDIVVRF